MTISASSHQWSCPVSKSPVTEVISLLFTNIHHGVDQNAWNSSISRKVYPTCHRNSQIESISKSPRPFLLGGGDKGNGQRVSEVIRPPQQTQGVKIGRSIEHDHESSRQSTWSCGMCGILISQYWSMPSGRPSGGHGWAQMQIKAKLILNCF